MEYTINNKPATVPEASPSGQPTTVPGASASAHNHVPYPITEEE